MTRDVPDSSTWDFSLPFPEYLETLDPDDSDESALLSMRVLLRGIEGGRSLEEIKTFLSHFDSFNINPQRMSEIINETIEGFPAMFYVVAANIDANLRLFAKLGGNVNATYGTPPVPLLAFAIINSKISDIDTTSMVATLLSLGAHGSAIPKPFFCPYDKDISSGGPPEVDLKESWEAEETRWCQPSRIQKLLTEAINITHRYSLYRSFKLAKSTARQTWVTARHDCADLFNIPYSLIGQGAAIDLLIKNLLHNMLHRHNHPLVLTFAGPSGHGKTELARRLGSILSLKLQVIDCTIVKEDFELFGPRQPYFGAYEGTSLNNFLATNSGQKCIVFLDEFEKTTKEIWNALLIPFDKGRNAKSWYVGSY